MPGIYEKYKSKKVSLFIDSIENGWRVFPPSLQIALTDYCFNKCFMCGHWKRENKNNMDCARLISFLELGKENGLQSVCYSGGDPFLWRELNDLMNWHIKSKIAFGFITAGFIPDWVSKDKLKSAEWVRVSLDSIGDSYSLIRGGNISPKQIIDCIKDCLDLGINIELGITISSLNIDQIFGLVDLACIYSISNIRFWPIRGGYEIDDKKSAISILTRAKAKLFDNKIDNNIDTAIEILKFGEYSNSFLKCWAIFYQLFIEANGDVLPCCVLAGDTKDKNLSNPLFNINDISKELIYEKIKSFHNSNLLNICKNSCITRLASINMAVENNINKKNFF
jgi:MoaA/NifB/PqqE/SkfB family radical SAM enzyme